MYIYLYICIYSLARCIYEHLKDACEHLRDVCEDPEDVCEHVKYSSDTRRSAERQLRRSIMAC